jgi:nucleoside-diphosphate-sugar epimerase
LTKIAIFGATSQIAGDLILSMSESATFDLLLYARDINKLNDWLKANKLIGRYGVFELSSYGKIPHGVVINFVGVGDPAKAAIMGSSIFEATRFYDQIILNDLKKNPSRKYIFLSSGAVYGADFSTPAAARKPSKILINSFDSTQYYSVSKLYAECMHRSLHASNIIDLRVFNYFSCTNNINSRFFITDVLRAIDTNSVFKTSRKDITRDYIHPVDFFQLIVHIIRGAPRNWALDCYSACKVTKHELLNLFVDKFGLKCVFTEAYQAVNATGQKDNYFSEYKIASEIGYQPQYTSLGGIELEASKIL